MSAGKKLTANTTVINPETGLAEALSVGQTVPDWAKDQVTNPALYAKDPYASDPGRRRAAIAEANEAEAEDEDPAKEDPAKDPGDPGKLEKPPVSGAGSGEAAWKAYADQEGVEYAKDAKKADIIAAVGAADSGE